jgi:hypothetical protein
VGEAAVRYRKKGPKEEGEGEGVGRRRRLQGAQWVSEEGGVGGEAEERQRGAEGGALGGGARTWGCRQGRRSWELCAPQCRHPCSGLHD